MNINHLSANIQRIDAELNSTKAALIATRALLFAALEQLEQRNQFDRAAIALPEEVLKNLKVKEWLGKAAEKPAG